MSKATERLHEDLAELKCPGCSSTPLNECWTYRVKYRGRFGWDTEIWCDECARLAKADYTGDIERVVALSVPE